MLGQDPEIANASKPINAKGEKKNRRTKRGKKKVRRGSFVGQSSVRELMPMTQGKNNQKGR